MQCWTTRGSDVSRGPPRRSSMGAVQCGSPHAQTAQASGRVVARTLCYQPRLPASDMLDGELGESLHGWRSHRLALPRGWPWARGCLAEPYLCGI
eukprot:652652-Prymnesium_polylepis.1